MKDVVLTPRGPKPIGPYSQAVKANGFLFVSGQVALDPQTGEFAGTDVRQQTERVMENLKAILEAGLAIPHAIKVIGAGNVHYSDLLRVPLSTVDQSSSTIGDPKNCSRCGSASMMLCSSAG